MFFSDASTVAIVAVAYLRVIDWNGQCYVGFIMGKSKLAPRPDHTVPHLLFAAILSVELAELILEEMDFEPDAVKYYTDSKIELYSKYLQKILCVCLKSDNPH